MLEKTVHHKTFITTPKRIPNRIVNLYFILMASAFLLSQFSAIELKRSVGNLSSPEFAPDFTVVLIFFQIREDIFLITVFVVLSPEINAVFA